MVHPLLKKNYNDDIKVLLLVHSEYQKY